MIDFDPPLGSHIDSAIGTAIRLAKSNGKVVKFNFNGIALEVDPDSRTLDVRKTWDRLLEERSRAYENSLEYALEQSRRAEENEHSQKVIDSLMLKFDDVVREGLLPTLAWVSDFSGVADNSSMVYDANKILHGLQTFTHANSHVGRTDLDDPKNKIALAEYILGQAISVLEKGLPPHPLTVSFASRVLNT